MQRANREGDCDALALERIPDVGANGVVDLVDSGMIAHVILDLVDHGGIGKIDEKNFYLRFGENALRTGGCSEKRILHAIGWVLILDSDANPHRMDLRWVMKIDDRLANDLVVWDIQINSVVCPQPCRAPVDLHDFSEALAHLQPVAHFIGPVNLNRYAGDDSAEKILPGESENDRDDPGAGEQSFQLRFSVIAGTQDKKKRDQKNHPADDFTKKMRNRGLP